MGWFSIGLTVLAAGTGLGQEPLSVPEEEPYLVEAGEMEMVKTPQGRMTHLRGGVVITHGPTVLRGEEGVVYEDNKKAVLRGAVEILDGSTTLTSKEASYERERKIAILSRDVRVVDGARLIEADEVVYDRSSRVAVGKGSVKVTDEAEDFIIWGNEGSYDFAESYGVMYSSPRLSILGEGEPISIACDTAEMWADGRSVVRGDVTITQSDLSAQSDSAIYWKQEGKAVLTGGPQVRNGGDWLMGKSIQLFFEEGKLDSMVVREEGKGLYSLENKELNEIKGEVIRVSFDKGEVTRVVVEGGAAGAYRFTEEEK